MQRHFQQWTQGAVETTELCFHRKDGALLWVLISATPQLAADGHFAGGFAMLADITERKQDEEALRESEQRFRQLFDTMRQGVVYQDVDGHIIRLNPAALRIIGKTQEDLLGETSFSIEQDTIREDGSPFRGRNIHPWKHCAPDRWCEMW